MNAISDVLKLLFVWKLYELMFYEVLFMFRSLICWHDAFSQDFSMVGLAYVNLSFTKTFSGEPASAKWE